MATEAELYDLLDRCARAHVEFESACEEVLSADIRDDAACERAGDRLILAMEGGVVAGEAERDVTGSPAAARFIETCQVMLGAVPEAAAEDKEHRRGH